MEAYYSNEQLQWRSDHEEKDKAKKRFFEDLNHFPNLFSLSTLFHDMDHMQALLRRKEEELQDGYLQYQLEKVRCHNLIIFLQYLLGCKQKALDYCQALREDNSKSIIFLTLQAMLQYELRPPKEHKKTLATLQDLYKASDFGYLQAVAEAEKGYVLISIGPIGFLNAMDLLQKAINKCPNSDIFLWKYDLALAIRRNFNIGAYSEHPELAAQVLAQKAIELLRDTAAVCPNNLYKVRSKVELARLISHLTFFCTVCTEDEKVAILKLIEDYNERDLFEEAFNMVHSKDFYTIRECGRYFLHVQDYNRAMHCFQASYSERKTSMACQLFGKAYLKMYKSGFNPPIFPSCMDLEGQSELPSTSQEPTADLPQAVESSMGQSERSDDQNMMSSEWQRLYEKMDSTPFMDKEGNLLTSQTHGIENLRPPSSGPRQRHLEQRARVGNQTEGLAVDSGCSPQLVSRGLTMREFHPVSTGACVSPDHHLAASGGRAPPNRTQSAEERKLLEDFDKDLYINPDGSFKTTQLRGIDSIYTPQDRPQYKTSKSCPPSVDTGREKNPRSGHARPRPKVKGDLVFKAKHGVYHFDASDRRVQTAEEWYLQGLQINPGNNGLRYDTGLFYEGLQKLDKALEHYQFIISCKVHKGRVNAIHLVDTYERSGLCLIEMSEQCQDAGKKEKLKEEAEDMFMSSLLECRQAVAHLPQISRQRASLWQSYPALLELLHRSQQADSWHLQKEAKVHEVVGKHLEAVKVYQEAMELARNDRDRTSALCGTVSNYLRMNNIKEARFILDLFLTCEEECQLILASKDEATADLRRVAVEVYSRAGKEALSRGDKFAAQNAFRWALHMKNKLPVPARHLLSSEQPSGAFFAAADDVEGADNALIEKVDVAIFCDDRSSTNGELLSAMADALATACKDAFGMRVSVNEENVTPGRLSFTGELQLAESAPLVMLVIAAGPELSPRMQYIADTVVQCHNKDCMLVCLDAPQSLTPTDMHTFVFPNVGDFPNSITTRDENLRDFIVTDNPAQSLPVILRNLRQLCKASELLALNDSDVTKNMAAVCRFFDFLLEDIKQ